MKVALSERQLKLIASLVEADSDTTAASTSTDSTATTSSSTTSTSGTTASYPNVTKWESGVTRGPANQIAVTKWEDVVSMKTRGKANPLNEQTGMPGGNGGALAAQYLNGDLDTKTTEYPTPWGSTILIPADSINIKTWEANDTRLGYYLDRVGKEYTKDSNGNYLIKGKIAPSEAYMQAILPTGTLRTFTTKKDNIKWFLVLKNTDKGWFPNQNYFRDDPKNPNKFLAYNPSDYITKAFTTSVKEWATEHWVDIVIIVAAAITGGLTGIAYGAIVGTEAAGAEAFNLLGWRMTEKAFAAYLGEAGVWTGRAAWEAYDGKYGSAGIDMFFGLILPGLHGVGISKWGIRADDAVINSTAAKVLGKTPQELEELIAKSTAEGGLTDAEKQLVQEASQLSKESIEGMTKELIKTANANIKAKAVDLTKNPILKQAKEIIETSKVGAFVKKYWFTWLPTILGHDLIFLHLIDSVAKKFGIIDKGTVDIMVNGYNNAKTEVEKQKYVNQASTILQKSGSKEEYEKHLQELNQKIEKSIQYTPDNKMKWNITGNDLQKYADSVSNVYSNKKN